MRAIRLHAFGGPEGLRLDEVPTPTPGKDEVRTRVHVSGLNFTDLGQREGRIPGTPPLPFIPGLEVAGVVDAVGPDVRGLEPGTRVVALLPSQGGFAEQAVVPVSAVLPLPEGVSFEQAVCLPAQAPTALLGLREGAKLREGESVYIPSAAGGVGSLLVQLAKRLGAAKVIGGTSSEDKRALVLRLGADAVVDTSRDDWPMHVREATSGQGADIVFVAGGGAIPASSLRALAFRGRLVLFGAESMFDTAWSREQMMGVLAQNQSVVGFATFTLPFEQRQAALREALGLVERRLLQPVFEQGFPLEAVAQAHQAMAARKTTGKVLIRVA
ncbi:NADPH:quinone oxidoreductase family protein [Myxococcus sp. AS-1-15]|uniref:quinone oxidoreductase family protein n=1 Tax=Myxococcus sp. AS-1-15 TaxID=2874600 RepID=UPI001CC023A1|nr:NADPH:quinone oxidoreductase family protein [Myxococcus sp. AS-1-15]MBZ4396514.1 NADPH:quinone oxidoreductase family protein [Myxococcus sp. AS-1-15]